MITKTLGELAKYVNGKILGDPNIQIRSAATLGKAGNGDISFLANLRYIKQLHTTKAGAIIVGKDTITETKAPLLVAEDPYYSPSILISFSALVS